MKVLSKRRSRLSKVILPEELELELELESEEGLGVGVETVDGAQEEDGDMGLDDGSLGRTCSDMDLDEEVQSNSSHHTVTSYPELFERSTK